MASLFMSYPPSSMQNKLIECPLQSRIWLEGPAGTGKTSAAAFWIANRIERLSDHRFLLFTPQRTLLGPYQQLQKVLPFDQQERLELRTFGSFIRQMLSLFWPELMPLAGFNRPHAEPTFLAVDSAQYQMGLLVNPLLASGHFETVRLAPNRLYAQLLDNLNKSALVGFSHEEIGMRLKSAWSGSPSQIKVYDDVQTAINLFRNKCLEDGLLDLSLQVELFTQVLSKLSCFQDWFKRRYQVLVYDNCEEDPPVYHDLMLSWLEHSQNALMVFDTEAGFRSFLGADPASARRIKDKANQVLRFEKAIFHTPAIDAFIHQVETWQKTDRKQKLPRPNNLELLSGNYRFFPELLDNVADKIAELIDEGQPPESIIVLSPFVSEVLRYSLEVRLQNHGLSLQTLRPSAEGIDDPALRNLLTLGIMANPQWNVPIHQWNIANTLAYFVNDLDIVRAQTVASNLVADQTGRLSLGEATQKLAKPQSDALGRLFGWLAGWQAQDDLRVFYARIFNELLASKGFSWFQDPVGGMVTNRLIHAIDRFLDGLPAKTNIDVANEEFVRVSLEGLIFGLDPAQWSLEPGKVLLLPTTTFLMQNIAVAYQFWLGIGSPAWYQRLEQPLTHPYVLSRNWPAGKQWTAWDEQALSKNNIEKILKGLARRSTKKIFLCHSQYGESGQEERGLMIKLLQSILKQCMDGRYD